MKHLKSEQDYTFQKALRPFSLSVAVVTCSLGILLAWYEGYHDILNMILILLGGILAQAGINLINDIEDLVDLTIMKPAPLLVIKQIKHNIRASFICFGLASLIALYLIIQQGWILLFLVLISAVLSLNYNIGFNFKQRGLALVLVFLLMGVMMVQGAYLAISGYFSWLVLWHSLPISVLVALLLLSNEIRDWEIDQQKGIHTLTVRIGYLQAVHLYWWLIGFSYFIAGILFIIGYLSQPLWLLLPLIMLFLIKPHLNATDRKQLTPLTGRFLALFGLAYLLAV